MKLFSDLSVRAWWMWFAVAAASFLPALAFYYVGEEAIFPISALEMWYHGEPVRRLLFGGDLQHNPLFAWLIIPLASLLGWEAVLPVTRAIAITSTIATGVAAAWLAQALYADRAFSAFVALVYLTLADLFFYRGWLAYVDPLFALLTFCAIACLWVACERRQLLLIALALGCVFAAFMAARMTAYVFYAATGLVLLFRQDYRRFLLSWPVLAVHVVGAVLPAVWLALFAASRGQGARMFDEILAKLTPETLGTYFAKLAVYPLETLIGLAPAGWLALWLVARHRSVIFKKSDPALWIATGIVLLNFLPYWLAPQSHLRYLMPLYPLAGLIIARVLWAGGTEWLSRTRQWLVAAIALKLILVLIVFPWYQISYRGANYAQAAQEILKRTAGYPLYTANVSASGLSVAAYIDVARLPQPPLVFPPSAWHDGYVMAYEPDPKLGAVAERYRLGGNDLYLLCRGAACTNQGVEGLRK